MPTFSIESPQTGQTYQVQFDREPSPEDLDFAAKQFDNEWWQQQGIEPGSEITQQTPLETVGNRLLNIGPDALASAGGLADLGATMGRSPLAAFNPVSAANELTRRVTGMDPLAWVAEQARGIQAEGEILRPTNPANPTANTIGSAVNQVGAMIATAGTAAAAGVPVKTAATLVPQAIGFGAGAGQGIDTARQMGIENSTGQAAMGMAFGGVEALTEKIGGIGGDMLKPAGTVVGKVAQNVVTESGEEVLAGRAQDALTVAAGQFVADPQRPGYTVSGYQLPSLNPLAEETLAKMKQEAIGGAVGGTIFSGIEPFINRQGVGQPMSDAQAAEQAQAASDLEEDAGALTAADIQDLETLGRGDGETQKRQPILTGVPDAVSADAAASPMQSPVGDMPSDISPSETAVSPAQEIVPQMDTIPAESAPQALPNPPQTITGPDVQTGTAMPVPPPTADAGAGAGEVVEFTTAKGSTYVLHADGTTVRDKAARPEHPGQQGIQPRSSKTIFVDPAGMDALGIVQTEGIQFNLEALRNGAWGARAIDGPHAGKFYATSITQVSHVPQIGLIPVEIWERPGKRQAIHFGNKITKITPTSTTATQPATAARTAPAASVGGGQGVASGGGAGASQTVAPAAGEVNLEDVNAELQLAGGFTNLDVSGRTAGFLNTEILAEAEALVRRGVRSFAQWSQAMVQRFGEAIREFLGSIWQQIKPMAADALMNYMQRTGSIKMLSETGEMPRRVNVQNGKVKGMTTSAIDVLYQDSAVLPKPTSKTSNDTVAKNLQEAAVEQWGRVITSEDIQPDEEAMIVANGVDEVLAGWGASGKTAADWYTTNVEAAMAVAEVIHDELSSDAAAQRVRVNGRQVFRNREDAKLAMYVAMAITSQNLNVNQNTTYAEEQFNLFKRNGEFDSSRLYGDKAKSISANLALANLLIRKLGWEEMHETVKADYTVKALSDLASKVTGRKVTIAGRQNDIVQGAALFGPKIGQGFLQNLMGNFYPVTIDLWMRRTWGRWTGDVLGDGITGERLARLIDEARRIGLMLPSSLARTRPVVRHTEKGKPFRTMSEDFIDRVENEEDLRQEINNYTKEVVAIWTRKYNAVQSGITQAQRASLLNGSVTMDSVADASLRDEERLNRRWEALKNKPKGKGAKEAWKQQQRQAHGRTQVLTTDEWNGTVNGVKNAGLKLKPKWALAANVIRSQLKPLDSPSDQDRVVISRIVNKIRVELESRGVKVSNADIQAILWYPEKDLWAKLRGEQESDLKQSYEEEFVRIANQRGRSREAAEAVARVRAARVGRSNDASANGTVRDGAQAAAVEKGFTNLDTSGRTAGFLNTEILSEARQLIADGFTTFANWSQAMVTRFGRGIREFLQGIWQQITSPQTNAAQNVRLGMPQGNAPVSIGAGGFVGTGDATAANETQARWASPIDSENVISKRPDAEVLAEAQAWLDRRTLEQAVGALENGSAALPGDARQRALGLLINRLAAQVGKGSAVQQTVNDVLLDRAGRLWHSEQFSAELGREFRQRSVVGQADLLPVAPVLAAKQVLVDRGNAVMSTRFAGGAGGAVAKVQSLHERVKAMLPNLLNNLRMKIAPGMAWAEIFTDMPERQKDRQRQIYRRLMLDERLKGLTMAERLDLTNELDRAWQRERRKVFQQELKKAGLLGEKDAVTRERVVNGLPKLLRLMNLGVLTADTFREALAPAFNLRAMTSADVARLRDTFNAAYKAPPGIQRNRLLQRGLMDMQKITGSTKIDLLNNAWVASVLSGGQTLFDTATTLASGGLLDTLTSAIGVALQGKPDVAITAVAEFWRSLPQLLREAGRILGKGELWYLRQFGEEAKHGLEGLGIGSALTGERLLSEKEIRKKALGLLLAYTGRTMAAFDHLTNNATKAGALPIARALNPELYQGALVPSDLDKANARAQAKLELPEGSPTEINRRAREILENGLNPKLIEEAELMGDMAAFQNDPTGFYGGVFDMVKSFFASGERGLSNAAEAVTNTYVRSAMLVMAGSLRAALGAKFIRFAMNWANKQAMLVPGTYLIQKAGVPIFGSQISRTQANYIMGRNVVGMTMMASFYAFLRGLLDKDDEEEGWHLTGGLEGVSTDRITALRAAGVEKLTLWKRDSQGRVVRQVNYKNMPFAAMLAALASTSDERKYLPEKHATRSTRDHLFRAIAIGAMQFKDISAVEGLSELFSKPRAGSSGEVAEDFAERLAKSAARFTTGFIPNALRDVDSWTDSRYFKPESAAAEWVKGVPFLRRSVNDGRPLMNLLGEEVSITRAPWNRQVKDVATSEAGRVLGGLLSRGLNVPGADGDGVVVVKDGRRVLLSNLGTGAVYAYQKAVGDGYKAWLGSDEGRQLLSLPPEQAERIIERRAQTIKRMAKVKAVGY